MSETPTRDPRDAAMSVAAISSERPETEENAWTRRLVLFLRVMALISIAQGLYHWAQVTGFVFVKDMDPPVNFKADGHKYYPDEEKSHNRRNHPNHNRVFNTDMRQQQLEQFAK